MSLLLQVRTLIRASVKYSFVTLLATFVVLASGSISFHEHLGFSIQLSGSNAVYASSLADVITPHTLRTNESSSLAQDAVILSAGVNQDLGWTPESEWSTILDSMVEAGVRSLRVDFRWYMLEPEKGVWDFALHDRLVAAVAGRGIRILGLLADVPTWANGQSGAWSGTYPPLDVADWSTYVETVVSHYSPTVEAWELWNEENIATFFRPAPDVTKYVTLLQAGYTAAKAAHPDTIVVLGGLAGNGVFMGWEPLESRDYLQKIYNAGGKDYFDVVAIHPYVHPSTAGIGALTQFVADTRAVMEANADPAPIWLTEISWPTTDDAWGGPTVSEGEMAQWVTDVFSNGVALGAERVYWYNFRDKGTDQTDLENSFGLIRFDMEPKPAFHAFRQVSYRGFEINAGLNDAWFNPLTDGQGFFITVFPDIGFVSLAWFTYDTELPDAGDSANLGDPGHRWLTALGSIDGNKSVMDISVASGGIFDTSTVIDRIGDGTIILTFSDCNSGTVEYDIPSIGQIGTVPIQRVATDNIALCEALIAN